MRLRHVLALLLVGFALMGCGSSGKAGKLVKQYGGEKTRPDTVAKRSIVLSYPHSNEKVALTYYHDGRYDKKALKSINYLFRDRRADVEGEIDPELIDFMVDIRTRLNLPPTIVFEILSGYRTEQSNKILARMNNNVAKESLHKHGWAVDFRVAGVNGSAIAEIAKTMQRGGVSYYPSDNHVHIDIGNIRTWHAS